MRGKKNDLKIIIPFFFLKIYSYRDAIVIMCKTFFFKELIIVMFAMFDMYVNNNYKESVFHILRNTTKFFHLSVCR